VFAIDDSKIGSRSTGCSTRSRASEQLVLLGYVVELLEERADRAMDLAELILRLIGGRSGSSWR